MAYSAVRQSSTMPGHVSQGISLLSVGAGVQSLAFGSVVSSFSHGARLPPLLVSSGLITKVSPLKVFRVVDHKGSSSVQRSEEGRLLQVLLCRVDPAVWCWPAGFSRFQAVSAASGSAMKVTITNCVSVR